MENDLKINTADMIGEWSKQAGLYAYWANKLADAIEEKGAMEAELEMNIREKPTKYNITEDMMTKGKPTEKTIMNVMITQAPEEVNDLRKEVNLLTVHVKALDHKKKALEKIVDLQIAGFNSEPKKRKRA